MYTDFFWSLVYLFFFGFFVYAGIRDYQLKRFKSVAFDAALILYNIFLVAFHIGNYLMQY